jgi:sporulation protein YlmC with PRC-barrel domain
MDIYTDSGQYLGEVKDATVDLERGEINRLFMVEWKNANKDLVQKTLQNKSILFKNIRNIGDVVLVSAAGQAQKASEREDSAASEGL